MTEVDVRERVKERIKKYWDSRGNSYDKSPGHSGLRDVWRDILTPVFREEMKILDVGTGTGFIALLLAELGHEVVGIDISEGMLEVARKKASKAGLKVEFKLGDAENLPFEDESFDAVISRHLLWTLPNPQKAVEEWKRVTRWKIVAIDGSWFSKSLSTRLRRLVGQIAIAICERRIPWRHYGKEIDEMLPLKGNSTPENVATVFRSAGLRSISVKDLSWVRRMILEEQPFFYRFAWVNKAYFMVEGFKEV
jgi:ubiquinone/menaquinone biosynthesis C-methylase UbiE